MQGMATISQSWGCLKPPGWGDLHCSDLPSWEGCTKTPLGLAGHRRSDLPAVEGVQGAPTAGSSQTLGKGAVTMMPGASALSFESPAAKNRLREGTNVGAGRSNLYLARPKCNPLVIVSSVSADQKSGWDLGSTTPREKRSRKKKKEPRAYNPQGYPPFQ